MNSLVQPSNWVTTVTISLPDYASQLVDRLESVMKDTSLSTVEALSCALDASLAVG